LIDPIKCEVCAGAGFPHPAVYATPESTAVYGDAALQIQSGQLHFARGFVRIIRGKQTVREKTGTGYFFQRTMLPVPAFSAIDSQIS
jgi:hypothetical protein